MNITWIEDYNFLAIPAGGAEMSDRAAYLYGLQKGHNLQLLNPESTQMLSMDKSDLLVISNAARFDFNWILRAASLKPYILYLHDYFPICKYRLFYPMLEKCKKCKNLEFTKPFVLKSALNVFLSPLHLDAWSFCIPEVKDHPYIIHPSPVDVDLFKPVPGVQRNPRAGIVINPAEFKGFNNIIKYCETHRDITFTFVGGLPENARLSPNCAYTGRVPNERMPGMLAQASYYVELPDTPQPYNRTCLEARLMEVPHLILNDNIGALSYPWFRSDTETIRKEIREAVPKWWERVEAVMK